MPFHVLTDQQLQCCHYWHLQRVENTRIIEAVGHRLMAPGAAMSAPSLLAFSQQVCQWGGKTGARVYGRIRKNPRTTMVASFTRAIDALSRSDLLNAKLALGPVKGLGAFSYSSKHLRMLAPQLAPVLDHLVDDFLVSHSVRYAHTSINGRFLGYADFCRSRALQLTGRKVKLGDILTPADLGSLAKASKPAECRWTAADIDMACFAWLQGWCAAGGASVAKIAPGRSITSPTTVAPMASGGPDKKSRPLIFLAQDHVRDTAITIKEECGKRWNNAWICRTHGSLDFKNNGARGTTRYLIGEILSQGVNVTKNPSWERSHNGKTCHHDGSNYQGRLRMGSVEDAVRYLKRFFNVQACDNRTETQAWINTL